MMRAEHPPLLVTGASGLLGAAMILTARERGRSAVGVYHTRPIRFDGVETVGLDLRNGGEFERLAKDIRPAWVIHCAALTDVDACETDPDAARVINTDASGTVAAAAARAGAGVVYISTDAFWSSGAGSYREEDPTDPPNVYARSKLAGEDAVRRANPRHFIARTNIFGWSPYGRNHLVEWIVDRLEGGLDVPGFTDVRFNPLLANDLALLVLTIIDRGLTGLYHVASGERVTKFRFAQIVASQLGFDTARVKPVSITATPRRAARPHDTTLSVDRITAALGQPMPTVASGVRWMRELREEGYVQMLEAGTAGAAV